MIKKYFPRGSEWRKWDLHVHSPASVHNDFPGTNPAEKWNNYFTKLRSLTDISVLGITDYFSVEGFKKVRDEGNLTNLDLLLPNVELRILPVTDAETPINMHIIFSPDIVDDLDTKFFSSLDFSYQGENFKCLRPDLIKLGKKYRNDNSLVDDIAYKNGIEQFKTTVDKIQSIFSKDRKLRDKSIVIVSNSSRDGTSGIAHSSLAATRQEIYRFAKCIFSSNPNDKEYFLGKGTDSVEEVKRKYGELKACVHGSDAHKIEEICFPCSKRSLPNHNCLTNVEQCDLRYCWIKADPTFEGLKQIIFEQEDRVHIGKELPYKIGQNKTIKSISLGNSNAWFKDEELVLNSDMISVIGGKGSGKTALLDLIAFAGNKDWAEISESDNNFLGKARKELSNLTVSLSWYNEEPDSCNFNEPSLFNKKNELSDRTKKIVYLSQGYITKLCSKDSTLRLQEQIERVIFQKIEDVEKGIYSDFASYKESKLSLIKMKQYEIQEQIDTINSRIDYCFKLILEKITTKENLTKQEKELENIKNEVKKISDDLNAVDKRKAFLQYQKFNQDRVSIEKEIALGKESIRRLDELNERIRIIDKESRTTETQFNQELATIGIKEKLSISLSPKNLSDILAKNKEAKLKTATQKTSELKTLNAEITKLAEELKLEKTRHDKLIELGRYEKKCTEELEALRKKSATIIDAEKELVKKKQEQEIIFLNFFVTLHEEKAMLEAIYKPLEDALKISSEENERYFRFSIALGFDYQNMAELGDQFIDHRKEGNYWNKDKNALLKDLEDLKEQISSLDFSLPLVNVKNKNVELDEKNQEQIKGFLAAARKLFVDNNVKDIVEEALIKSQIGSNYTIKDFYDWLFSTNYYNLSYSIRFNENKLEDLSPGLKGVALLILYLELDKEDNRPILIDQPEENLDNRFIYSTLIKYFRRAKNNRQVIIATHNANLVVNTDSEQVIVANFDKDKRSQAENITYILGALENSYENPAEKDFLRKKGIRQHVCEILEGGKEAFQRREKKYDFPE